MVDKVNVGLSGFTVVLLGIQFTIAKEWLYTDPAISGLLIGCYAVPLVLARVVDFTYETSNRGMPK